MHCFGNPRALTQSLFNDIACSQQPQTIGAFSSDSNQIKKMTEDVSHHLN